MDWRDAEAAYRDPVIGQTTLPRLFEESADRNLDRVAQRYKGGVYSRSLVSGGVVDPAPDGEFADLTYGELRGIVRTLAAGFRDLGVAAGDRVGIFAHTRMEWAQVDFALLAAGGVVTTVYTTSSPRQVRYLLGDAGATAVVVENAELLDRVLAARELPPESPEGDADGGADVDADGGDIDLDGASGAGGVTATEADDGTGSRPDEDRLDLSFIVVMDDLPEGDDRADREDVYTLADVYERGAEAYDHGEYESWLVERSPSDVASLIYTSGTTGDPKGVCLTHRNFRSNVNQCYRRFGPRPDKGDLPVIDPGATTLSFLPLAHVFERLAGHFLMFAAGATVAYAESPDTLREDFRLVRPTTGTSVPRVYEKLYDAIRARAAESAAGERLFEWAVDVGRRYRESDAPGASLSLQYRLADRLVFSRVREALGGRVEFLISGGGSLSADLCALYHAMGLPVLEGYGLTETAPVVAANPIEEPKVGTIGPPVEDVEVLIDATVGGDAAEGNGDAGELLVRGPNVADGYWNRPAETAAAFVEDPRAPEADGSGGSRTAAGTAAPPGSESLGTRSGTASPTGAPESEAGATGVADDGSAGRWFRTGDVVERRPDGYLVFRGRLKQLMVLSTGKNVAPLPIEDAFVGSDVVEQCMLVGDGRRFVSALLVPDFEELRAWGDREEIELPDAPDELCRDERVRQRVRADVDRVNDDLEPHERIKRFRLLPEEFTPENDLATPTLKKKRRNVLDRYGDLVDAIYGESRSDRPGSTNRI